MLHVESLEQEEEISEREGGQMTSQRGGRSSLSTRGGSLKDFARWDIVQLFILSLNSCFPYPT